MKCLSLCLRSIIILSSICCAQRAYAQHEHTQHEHTQPATDDRDNDDDETPEKTSALRIPTGIGNMLVGANLLFANATFQKGYEASYTGGISPRIGFFILPNIALGLSADLTIQGNKSYRSISYGASPFARVYFAHNNTSRAARPLQAFVEAGVGYGGTNSRYENATPPKVSTNGLRLSVMPGVDYFLDKHVAVEAALGYQFISGNPDAHILALNIGMQVFLSR